MSSEPNLKELFENWNDLNNKVQELMSNFDLANVKEVRKKQQVIEDIIYMILRENAPNEFREVLPEDCGELEVGYDTNNNEFYFVMIDPNSEDSDEAVLLAFNINIDKSVKKIENFEMGE
jgi:uncharacterized protein YdcH (DUF465 family)